MPRLQVTPMRVTIVTSVLAGALLQGCSNPLGCGGSQYNAQRFTDVELAAGVMAGDTSTFVVGFYPAQRDVTGTCGAGNYPSFTSATEPGRFHWSSSDPSVFTVDSRGKIHGVGVGMATVTVTTSGAPAINLPVYVVPRVAAAVVRPSETTARVGDVVRFEAYVVDAAGQPIDMPWASPYPVNLRADPAQDADVVNYLPEGPRELRKRFDKAGTYRLDLITAVRNAGPFDDAAVVTVVP